MSLPTLIWVPSPNFSNRSARVDLLVLHDTEGSYQSAINWFKMTESQVSAHFVIKEDGSEVTQMVDIGHKAWHACYANSRSIGFEMAGISTKGFGSPELLCAASIFAFHLHHLQIPLRHAIGGVGPGLCSHYELGMAGGGHSDPSRNPEFMANFFILVTQEYNKANFPLIWLPEKDTLQCGLVSKPLA